MKEFKGTPGPWEIEDDNPYLPFFDIVSDCEETYISVYTFTEEAIHNANLIAAAPELLSALQKIVESGHILPHLKIESQWAIAKALGESQ